MSSKAEKNMNKDPEALTENAKHVAKLMKLLANHYRLLILCVISEEELTVGQINSQIDLSQSALSQHLAKLREQNIVKTRKESQTVYYQIADEKVKDLLIVLQDKFC